MQENLQNQNISPIQPQKDQVNIGDQNNQQIDQNSTYHQIQTPNKQKVNYLLFIIVLIGLLTMALKLVFLRKNTPSYVKIPTPTPSFEDIALTLEGPFHLIGYATMVRRDCDQMGIMYICDTGSQYGYVDYVYFVFSKTDNNNIYTFLDEQIKGASGLYMGDEKIGHKVGLGCYEKDKNRIYSNNYADSGSIGNVISGGDLERLLTSDEDNQVVLTLNYEWLTVQPAREDCLSYFRNFEVD